MVIGVMSFLYLSAVDYIGFPPQIDGESVVINGFICTETHVVTECEVNEFSMDMDGNVRGADSICEHGGWDRGAYEFVSPCCCIDCDGDGYGFPRNPAVCPHPEEDTDQFNPDIPNTPEVPGVCFIEEIS